MCLWNAQNCAVASRPRRTCRSESHAVEHDMKLVVVPCFLNFGPTRHEKKGGMAPPYVCPRQEGEGGACVCASLVASLCRVRCNGAEFPNFAACSFLHGAMTWHSSRVAIRLS